MKSGKILSRRLAPVLFLLLGRVLVAQELAVDGGEHHHVHQDMPTAVGSLADIRVDFELTGASGQLVRDEDFRGRHLLLGFGFTRCTDVCPIMVARMAATIGLADGELAGAFVSVDTERDSPASVHAYTTGFNENITGLGGSLDQINAAASNFRVSYVVTKTQRSYTVQHTSHMFLIDPQGELVDVFPFTESSATILAALD